MKKDAPRSADLFPAGLDSLPVITRRQFLRAAGPASAAVLLMGQPQRLCATTPSMHSAPEDPPEYFGRIAEMYAEPKDLDKPHEVNIKTLHLWAYNDDVQDVPGTWTFELEIYVNGTYHQQPRLFTRELAGVFKGRGSRPRTPNDTDNYMKIELELNWDIYTLSVEELRKIQGNNNSQVAYPWKLKVNFMKSNPQVGFGFGSTSYYLKDHTGAFVASQHKPDYSVRLDDADELYEMSQLQERKYAQAFRVFGLAWDDQGSGFVKLTASNRNKEFQRLIFCFAMAGTRTVVANSAGAMPPEENLTFPRPDITTLDPDRDKTGDNTPIKRLWLVHTVLVESGAISPTVIPGELELAYNEGGNFTWGGWKQIHNWSYPQADSVAGQHFDSAGYFAENGTDSGGATSPPYEAGNRPAIANSILARWPYGQDLEKLGLERVTHAAWAQQANGDRLIAAAVPDPGYYAYKDGITWYLSPQTVSEGVPLAQNRAPKRDSPLKCVGPGLFCDWVQTSLTEAQKKSLTPGFWWNVQKNGSDDLTDIGITDHNESRLFETFHLVKLRGPVDLGKLKLR